MGPGEAKHVLVVHDESTFSSNDGEKTVWGEYNGSLIRKKGIMGKSLMISAFLCECHGLITHEEVKHFAQNFAAVVVNLIPEKATTNIRKEKREDKVFIDILRNNYAQTAVAPYSLRALPQAPVATPISWDEVFSTNLSQDKYNIFTAFEYSKTDPWKDFDKKKNYLK